MSRSKILLLLALVLFAASCNRHNVPNLSQLNASYVDDSDVIRIYTDMLGDLYPCSGDFKSDYREDYEAFRAEFKKTSSGAFTLWNSWNAYDHEIAKQKWTDRLTEWSEKYDRICIYVHGYNAGIDEDLDANYRQLRERTNAKWSSEKIGHIYFHWDGLRSAAYWSAAQLNSCFAGDNGMRIVLNSVTNKPTLLVSHSRGAAVVLSALSPPTFMFANKASRYPVIAEAENGKVYPNGRRSHRVVNADFLTGTRALLQNYTGGKRGVVRKFEKLTDLGQKIEFNPNNISAILIAPGVGTYAFMKELDDKDAKYVLGFGKISDEQIKNNLQYYRNFGNVRIILGHNKNDPTVSKHLVNTIKTKLPDAIAAEMPAALDLFPSLPGRLGSSVVGANYYNCAINMVSFLLANQTPADHIFMDIGVSHKFYEYVGSDYFLRALDKVR